MFRYLEKLDISGGCTLLVTELYAHECKHTHSLTHTGNQMSKLGCKSLTEFLSKHDCHIVSLKADHANLSDASAACECERVHTWVFL